MVPLNMSGFDRIRFSEDSHFVSFLLETHIPLFSSKYQILSKCRFQIFQLGVSGLILVPIRQFRIKSILLFNESSVRLRFVWGR